MQHPDNWPEFPPHVQQEQQSLPEIEKNLRIRQWRLHETPPKPDQALQSPSWQQRALAIQALFKTIAPNDPDYSVIEQIEQHMNSTEEKDPKVRIIAIQALGKLHRANIIPVEPLWRPLMVDGESDPEVKAAAAEELASLGAEIVNANKSKILIYLLHSQEVAPNGRIAIMRLLELYHDQAVIQALLQTLKQDESYLVREAATFMLGRLLSKKSDESIIQALHDALYDPDKDVRSAAIYALGPYIRIHAILQATNELQKQAIAAQLLGEVGDKRAIQPLLHLAQHARSLFTRLHALQALRQIGARLNARTRQKELPLHVLKQFTEDNCEEIVLMAKTIIQALYPESRSFT